MLPAFYEYWQQAPSLAALTNPPSEQAFDCDSCFMSRPWGLTRDLGPFKTHLKCCTFQPYLPAFTLGALLRKQLVSKPVIEKFYSLSRLTPLGALPRERPTSICETGKNDEAACVFLSNDGKARCTIRDYRPSTCAGYVCRSNNGAEGLRAWQKWEAEIAKFEWSLAHLAAFELGRTFDDVESEFKSTDEAEEFYLRAFDVAMTLSP